MLKSNIYLILITLFCLLGVTNIRAQLSKKHFIPPLTYAETGNANPENQYFYISTPSNQNVSFTIKQVGFTSNDITGVVSSTSPQIISIGNGDSQLFVDSRQTSVVQSNKGYIIDADDAIYVSIRMLAGGGAQAGALVSKGASALGQTFRAGMFTNESPQDNYLNFISVMATENNTKVTFDDLPIGILIKNYTGTLPISNILLNEGESYILATNANDNSINRDALIGTLVNADKPIVVNLGSANGSFHNGGGRDYGIDQIVGIEKLKVPGKTGSDYIFVKGDGENGWENVLIVAHEDNTTIKINGSGVISTINKGEYFLIEGDNYNSSGNMFVESSKPTFAYQGIGANTSEANQGLFFVPPLSCENRGKVDNIPTIENIGSTTFSGGITIVTNKGATVSVKSSTQTFTPSGPFNVDGNTDYVTYKVNNLTGDISIESSAELYCAYFNQNGAASSGSFYSGFPSSPEINFDATVSTLGNCIPNVTLEAANTALFDEFEWFFDDETGGGFISTGNTNVSFKPNLPGRYQLVGKIICSGSIFKSIEVPVSICPDDYDGDLIIDNLDVDIDNDGILNCEESNGDATINITDINNPSIIFQDGTTNNITNSIYTETEASNTFIGDNLGNFESIINPATDTKLKYELKFSQNVNFKFTPDKTKDHTITEGEFFILKIGPNNKNITLLDPDDQLLIDTNFDGIFESGITYISASEIWFKYAVNTTGAVSNFEFLANQVNQLDFKHQSNGITTASTFNGNIKLTCFSKDSDGDGIENMFDLDSDNDGIPDIIEAFSQPISISGIDSNLDGLDDVFNDAFINLDIDSDGIKNYLDLDSDNDGIFDTTEAGHNLDTNFNGIVDNVNTIVGINGLADTLEATPDSKVLAINYIIANTDSDIEFNFLELDSDNDGCFDVIEAGFTDQNNDNFLGDIPLQIDGNGKVINTIDGYTSPNVNYITIAPITLNNPFENVNFCENETNSINIDSTADSFQWQASIDGSTWSSLSNNTIYTGTATKELQIKNTPLTFNNYQYRVLLSREGNSCTEQASNAVTLTVNPLPTIKTNPVILKQCDDNADLITTFNLTEAEISISDNRGNEVFEYYATQADAISGTPQVDDKLRYPVNTSGEAWVKTISEFGCFRISKLELIVSFAADVSYDKEFVECDDFLDFDGNNTADNSDTDGITFFNFSNAEQDVIALFSPLIQPSLQVLFYETTEDRTAAINEIPNISKHRNNKDPAYYNSQTIYIKIKNKDNNDCTGIGQLSLTVKPVPLANPIADLELCDDALSGSTTDGENANIKLRDLYVDDILGTTQTETDYIVSFHTTETGANTNTDIITTDNNFRNSAQAGFTSGDISEQTIFVRVQDRNGEPKCFNDHVSFKIIVNPIPKVDTTITELPVCDSDTNPRNRITQNIDLTAKDAEILAGKTNHRVAYYVTQQDAENGNEITNPTNFQNDLTNPNSTSPTNFNSDDPATQTIFFKVIDLGGNMCSSITYTFQLLVYPEPNIPVNISDYTDCDNTTDTDADDTNGRNGDITLKDKIPEILNNYDPSEYADFSVTFYKSLEDAESGDVSLAFDENKFENIINNQTIYVRVENTKNTPIACVHTRLSFNINIISLPEFDVTGEDFDDPQILCLNNTTPHILEAENPTATYNYLWTDKDGTELGTERTQIISKGGQYTVKATDKVTECYKEKTIFVKESEVATLLEEYVTIIDESNNIGSTDNISIFIDTLKNDLGKGEYQFAIRNEDTGQTTLFQDDPLFENLEGGVYTIIVTDLNGCVEDEELQISVIQFPKFFTPNADGTNDTWAVKGATAKFYRNTSINIFNRFGKIVAQIPIDSNGWDGSYNGKTLPTDDYWFNIQLIPLDTNKTPLLKKGHFSLLRKK
jgi:gliding motility-associated-like protein